MCYQEVEGKLVGC